MKIEKCRREQFPECKELSQKYCFRNVKDKSKGFIFKPLDDQDFDSLTVASIKGVVVGFICARPITEADWDFSDRRVSGMYIGKVLVNETYRGQNIASQLVEHILEKYPSETFYTSIRYAPDRNIVSENLFGKFGFRQISKVRWNEPELGDDGEWTLFELKSFDKLPVHIVK